MPSYIMLLNDGETWTNVEGCAIIAVPDEHSTIEAIEEWLDHDFPEIDDAAVAVFDLDHEGLYAHHFDGGRINLA